MYLTENNYRVEHKKRGLAQKPLVRGEDKELVSAQCQHQGVIDLQTGPKDILNMVGGNGRKIARKQCSPQ